MNKRIVVSVIMLVYNQQLFLRTAINSILNQSLSYLELIIINDGSTDNCLSIIKSFNDPRIVLYNFSTRKGLSERFNFGILKAKGEYIARMNAEDISLVNRIEYQSNFLNQNQDYAICGCSVTTIDDSGIEIANRYPVTSNDKIKMELLFGLPMISDTAMVRKDVLIQNSILLKKEYEGYEDYKLWIQLSMTHKIANLPEILFKQRNSQLEPPEFPSHKASLKTILLEQFDRLGIKASRQELHTHLCLFFGFEVTSSEILLPQNILSWFRKLNVANQKSIVYDKKLFEERSLVIVDFILSKVLFKSPFERIDS